MLVLRKNGDKRIRKGHLWIFSNEIQSPSVSEIEPGSIHEVSDHKGEFLGIAYANPRALIAARMLSRSRVSIDEEFFRSKILKCIEHRQKYLPDRNSYRVIFSEADELPGIIVDKYEDYLVVQSLTYGIELQLELIINLLVEMLRPKGVFLRNDSQSRALEGLEIETKEGFGEVPERTQIESRNLKFIVDLKSGQKTGAFLDQEQNRGLMHRYGFKGSSVLDLFSYTGGWGLHAAAAGSDHVVAVDSSQPALDIAKENAELNGLADRFTTVKDNVINYLKRTKDTFDLVILDPPAFVKNRAGFKEGLKGYIDVNRRAMLRLKPGGVLVTCSCSHHMDPVSFEEMIGISAVQSGRRFRLLEKAGQGPDHPTLLAMPETLYLKVMVLQDF